MKHVVLALVFALAWWNAPHARACGGIFCSQANPVVQNAERILFVDNGDGTITAVIEIIYEGPSTSFSWVLPVSGVPEVEVASTSLLAALDNATRPTLTPTRNGNGCGGGGGGGGCSCGCAGAGGSIDSRSFESDAGVDPVQVVGGGNVGPYDYVVISVDPLAANQADTARAWLMANGYDVSTFGADVLGAYLAAGLNLIAFRLEKTATSGSIRPVVMTYESTVGVIPIRPTAVAARNDMGVLVFMMGDSRAVPSSYDEIELSSTAIDWNQPSSSYVTAVDAAVDEAGGHAFVTEFAGANRPLASLGAEDARSRLVDLMAVAATLSDVQLLLVALNTFLRRSDFPTPPPPEGFLDALLVGIPGLDASVAANLVTCGTCQIQPSQVPDFEPSVFLAAIDEYVVTPLELSEDIASRGVYLTRLYTSLDPAEMTVDPVFVFATGLPDVSSLRAVTLDWRCIDGVSGAAGVELPSGESYDPRRLATTTPLVLRRIDYASNGVATVVTDNQALITAAVADAKSSSGEFRGCATGDHAGDVSLVQSALAALFVLLVVRRMRPTRA